MFSVDNTKSKRGWNIPFFNYVTIKCSIWVSYSFKAALVFSSLYRSMHFWCHDTALKKILSIEKLNLTWNKQTNFNKLCSFSRVFQILLSSRGGICLGEFFCQVVGIWQGVILTSQTFFKVGWMSNFWLVE